METSFYLTLFAIIAYLIGSLPTGYLVAKSKGIDIRKVGSGNIGGTNIWRNMGLGWGILVGLIDFLKSYLPSYLAIRIFHQPWQLILVSLMPVLGHIFPVWLKFKGGKGVSTIFGILMAYLGVRFFLAWFFVWIILLFITRIMSLTNLTMALLFPFVFWIFFKSPFYVVFGLLLTIIVWWTHRENIKRLIIGKENKLKF